MAEIENEIKKIIETEKVVFGKEQTLKNLKINNIKNIYVSSNCPAELKEDINHYSDLNDVKVIELTENNEELGVLCKKPFTISVLSILKK
ncbi:50S ribosomal protein L30e [Nanoarchaeota archaeon]